MAKKTKKQSEILSDIIKDARKQACTALENCYNKIDKARNLDGEGVGIEDGPMLPGGNNQESMCIARVFKGQVETDNGSSMVSSMVFLKFGEIDTDTLLDILSAMEDVVAELE